jgi:hypothetical protein
MAAIVALGALTLGGCASSPYSSEFRYQPRPVSVNMTSSDAPQANVRAMATIVGLRRPADQQPAAFDVRLMLDNDGEAPATFDPTTLNLVDASLAPFPKPTVDPPDPFTIAPGQSRTVNASFPIDDRDSYDLDGLNLRWSVRVGDHMLWHSATFNRRELPRSYYADPFYYDPYHVWHYNNYRYIHPYPRRYHRW